MNLSEDLFITCGHGGQQRTDPFPYRHLEPPTEMMKMKYSVGSGHAVLARGGIVAIIRIPKLSADCYSYRAPAQVKCLCWQTALF